MSQSEASAADAPTGQARIAFEGTPDSLENALKRERAQAGARYDCTSCRVMGASTFLGLAGYVYWSGHRELRTREAQIMKSGTQLNMAARRLGITGTAAALAGLGIYRALV